MPLIPRLYLSLLRLAKRFDKNPCYKCFVPSIRGVYYERMSSQWIPLDNTSSTVLDSFGRQKSLDDLTLLAFRELTRLYTGNGMFYHPEKLSSPKSHSITAQIKKNFRHSFNHSLDQSHRIDLAFLALRYLSRCINVASKLTSSSSSSSSSSKSCSSSNIIVPSHKVNVGGMLISHPLLYEKDSTLTQSCVLIVKHDEMLGSLGVVVNSPLHCTLGDRLSHDAMEKNPYLKCFLGCELYAGGKSQISSPATYDTPLLYIYDTPLIYPRVSFSGDVIADHPVALLHTKPLSIENQNQQLDVDDSSGSNGSTTVDPDNGTDNNTGTSPGTSANKSTSSTTKRRRNAKNSTNASRDVHRRSTNDGSIEITFPQLVPPSASTSSSASSSASTSEAVSPPSDNHEPSSLHFTSDLMWAARDIESGLSSHYVMCFEICIRILLILRVRMYSSM